MNLIGPQVRSIRESAGLTQDELATRCNLMEWDLSRSTLAKIESQVRRVTDFEVVMLARALRVDIEELFTE